MKFRTVCICIGLLLATIKVVSTLAVALPIQPPPIYVLLIDHAHHYVQTCQQIRWTTSGDIAQRPNIAEFGEPCVADTIFYDGMESP